MSSVTCKEMKVSNVTFVKNIFKASLFSWSDRVQFCKSKEEWAFKSAWWFRHEILHEQIINENSYKNENSDQNKNQVERKNQMERKKSDENKTFFKQTFFKCGKAKFKKYQN